MSGGKITDSIHSEQAPPSRLLLLPNELLCHIASFVRPIHATFPPPIDPTRPIPPDPYRDPVHLESIRNLRLTCRRLSWVASRYLVDSVEVDLTKSSLARLEAISRHPEISRGVRWVRVNVGFHPTDQAERIETFAAAYHEVLLIHQYRSDVVFGKGPGRRIMDAANLFRYSTLDALYRFVNSYRESATGSSDRPSFVFPDEAAWIRRAHDRFRARYAEERALIRGGLVNALTKALEQMPHATGLEIYDSSPDEWAMDAFETLILVEDQNEFEDWIIRPVPWAVAWHMQSREHPRSPGAPCHLLLDIPVAWLKAGRRLKRLALRASRTPELHPYLAQALNVPRLRKQVVAATGDLVEFHYGPRHPREDFKRSWYPFPYNSLRLTGSYWELIRRFLGLSVKSINLRVLDLNTGVDFPGEQDVGFSGLTVGNIMPDHGHRPWPNLECAIFRNFHGDAPLEVHDDNGAPTPAVAGIGALFEHRVANDPLSVVQITWVGPEGMNGGSYADDVHSYPGLRQLCTWLADRQSRLQGEDFAGDGERRIWRKFFDFYRSQLLAVFAYDSRREERI
jgi:hypothetical protein